MENKKIKNKKTKTSAMKIKWFKDNNCLSEIYQQTGMLFTFVTNPKIEGGSQSCHSWVKCRDFLPDAVRAYVSGNACSIYGFTYNKKLNPPIDTKRMRMLVSKQVLKEEDIPVFAEMMNSSVALLHHFERRIGISLTKMKEVSTEGSKQKAIYMFVSSPVWIQSPFMISMYTFLIRLGAKRIKFENKKSLMSEFEKLIKDKSLCCDNDVVYLKKSWDKLHTIIDNRTTLFPKKNGMHDINFETYNINAFHDRTGVQSLVNCTTPSKELNNRAKDIFNQNKTGV